MLIKSALPWIRKKIYEDVQMKELEDLLNSIYLGDRYCEKMEIDGDKIVIQINLISRVKRGCTEWDYYSEEDMEHGCLVFEDVMEYFSDNDLALNDEIYEIRATGKEGDIYSFIVCGCNVSDQAVSTDIQLRIKAKKFYLYDPINDRTVTG